MKFKKKNGLYRPEHYMGCMGIEDQFAPKPPLISAIRKGVMVPAGGGTSGGSAGGVAGEPSGLLICQNFEGAGYDNSESWTEYKSGDGVVNEDYTTTILRGAHSLGCSSGTSGDIAGAYSPTFSSTATTYIHLMWRTSYDADERIIQVRNDTTIVFQLVTVSAINHHLYSYCGTREDEGTFIWAANTTYHIWIDYKKGSGANAEAHVYIGTTTTKPGAADITCLDGSSTLDANNIYLQARYGGTEYSVFDQVYVDTEAIIDPVPA